MAVSPQPAMTVAVFRDAMDARVLPLLTLTFVVTFGGAAAGFPIVHEAMAPESTLDATALVFALERPAGYLIATAGLLLGIAQRPVPSDTTGSYPRVAAAIFMGRFAVFAVALVAGLLAAGLSIQFTYDDPSISPLVAMAVVSGLLGFTFVAMGVTIAILSPTRRYTAVVTLLVLLATVAIGSGLSVLPLGGFETALRAAVSAPVPITGTLLVGVVTLVAWLGGAVVAGTVAAVVMERLRE